MCIPLPLTYAQLKSLLANVMEYWVKINKTSVMCEQWLKWTWEKPMWQVAVPFHSFYKNLFIQYLYNSKCVGGYVCLKLYFSLQKAHYYYSFVHLLIRYFSHSQTIYSIFSFVFFSLCWMTWLWSEKMFLCIIMSVN